jgi:hypothetical protein
MYGIASPYPLSATPALFVKKQWIVCGSKTLLWLPPDYRTAEVAIFRDTIAFGHKSGLVSIMDFTSGAKTESPPHPSPFQA